MSLGFERLMLWEALGFQKRLLIDMLNTVCFEKRRN